jgi:hypothetical protein
VNTLNGRNQGASGTRAIYPFRIPHSAFRIFLLLLLFTVHCSLFAAVSLAADAVGRFTKVEGVVDILAGGALPGVPAKVSDTVSAKDVIRTKSASKAEITFTDGNIIKIAQRSRIDISEYAADESKNGKVIKLTRGKVEAWVEKNVVDKIAVSKGTNRFEIHTPNAVAGVRGTDYFVFYDKGITGVIVKEGKVYTYNQMFPDKLVEVTAGNLTTIFPNNAPHDPRPVGEGDINRHDFDVNIDGDKGKSEGETPSSSSVQALTDLIGRDEGISQSELPRVSTFITETPKSITDIAAVLPLTETTGTILGSTSTLTEKPVPPQINSKPESLTNSTTAVFQVSTTDPALTIKYGFDGLVWKDTTSQTVSLLSIPEGTNTLYLKTFDTAGNIESDPVTYTWTTDYTAPVLALSGLPDALTKQNTAIFTVKSSDTNGVTYSYKLDGNAVIAPSLTGLTEGTHTFTVTGTDAAGNVSSPAAYTWTTDYKAPVVTIDTKPAALTNVTTATFGITGSDANGVTYSYKLDGNAVTAPSLTGLTEGTHTFTVTGTDAAGNVSSPAAYTWTTDYTAPVVTIGTKPAALTNAKTATFGITGSDANGAVTYTYKLDGNAATTSLFGLTEGTHTFTVTGTDAAGNVSLPVTYTWTTDYTAPTASTFSLSVMPVSGKPLFSKIDSILTSSADGISSITYSLENGTPVTTSSGVITLNDIPRGSHILTYTVTDAAGNTSEQSQDFNLTRNILTGKIGDRNSVLSSSVTGDTAGVTNQNWGGWIINMPNVGKITSTLYAGGSGDGGSNGYWIDTLTNVTDTAGTISGVSDFKYLTYTTYGTGTGTVTGGWYGSHEDEDDDHGDHHSHDGDHKGGVYSITDTGTNYTETPLTHVSNVLSGSVYNKDHTGSLNALMGGTNSLWSGSSSIAVVGKYSPDDAKPHIWYSNSVYSKNYAGDTKTTYDGGAYYGVLGGREVDNNMEGMLYALYIDPSGNAGYLKSKLAGTAYPEINMFEMDSTEVIRQVMTIIPTGSLYNSIVTTSGSGSTEGKGVSGVTNGGSL